MTELKFYPFEITATLNNIATKYDYIIVESYNVELAKNKLNSYTYNIINCDGHHVPSIYNVTVTAFLENNAGETIAIFYNNGEIQEK